VRLINRLLAALLAVAVVVLGVLVVIEVVHHWYSSTTAVLHWRHAYSWAQRTHWTQGSIRTTCVLLVLAGLVLLVLELRPAAVSRLAADPDQTDTSGIDTGFTRRGVSAAVRSAVQDVDGVRSARVTVGRRRVVVTATTAARDQAAADGFRDPVSAAAQQRLAELRLRSTPSVSVSVTPRSR
jgi:Family of unknown function (DUF6286)